MRSRGRKRDLHKREEELPSGVTDGLFSVSKALDDGGDKSGVEVELEVVIGEHGGEVQSLEAHLRRL